MKVSLSEIRSGRRRHVNRRQVKKAVIASVVIGFWGGIQSSTFGANTYYVAPTGGSDSNSGAIDAPFATFGKAVSVAAAGDTIFARGGMFNLASTFSISKSGTAANRINLWAYPGETPILNFSAQAENDNNRGLLLSASADWWHVKGLTVENAGDNGVHVVGDNNILDQLVTRYNKDSGLQLHGTASNNLVLNCDSYENFDPDKAGEDADGFAAKFASLGPGNIFRGNRSWGNSDDGWDTWESPNGVLIQDSWSFDNGINIWGVDGFNGDGTGYKLGKPGGDHVLTNVLAVDNRTNGVDINENGSGVEVYNSTSFSNGRNWQFDEDTATHILKNNISYDGASTDNFDSAISSFNTWNGPAFAVSAADFQSTARMVGPTDLLKQPREADGSLPDLGGFLKLVEGSNLVNAGTPISFVFNGQTYNLPFNGAAPDLGAFETGAPPPMLPGDYNGDNMVDAADYAVWRDNLDQSVSLPNDLTPGSVDAADYGVWQTNFGRSGGSGAGAQISLPGQFHNAAGSRMYAPLLHIVPEPALVAQLAGFIAALVIWGGRSVRHSLTYF
jgi:hypothetical protein